MVFKSKTLNRQKLRENFKVYLLDVFFIIFTVKLKFDENN